METFVVRILRPVGDDGDDDAGEDGAGPRLRGVVHLVSRGREHRFSSGEELLDVLRGATFDASGSP